MGQVELLEISKKLNLDDFYKLIKIWIKDNPLNVDEAQTLSHVFINILIEANIQRMKAYKEHAAQAELATAQLFANTPKAKKEIFIAAAKPHIAKFKDRGFLNWNWLFEEQPSQEGGK